MRQEFSTGLSIATILAMAANPFPIYGLLDCNSFFASCEKLFRPDLADRPVVVLSNNDGVVVARSPEAKKLGVGMGEPYFKIKRLVEHGGLTVFSSNFRLYGEMSLRVMQMLYRWTPLVDIYSIDEAFLDFSDIGLKLEELDALLEEIVISIKRWTGIQVSLGLGPTMTLAKVANDIAKKNRGTCNLFHRENRQKTLARLEIGDVWGIGRRLAPKMRRLGIRTAADLAAVDPLWIRKKFSVVQEQLVRELGGECRLDMSSIPLPRKSIQVSRSFQEATDDLQTLSEAVATFAARACEKARSEGTVASAVSIHLYTSRYNGNYLSDGRVKGFDSETVHSPDVIRISLELLRALYRSGPMYKKAMVMLLDLRDAAAAKSQGLLFDCDGKTADERQRDDRLMVSVDQINRSLGKGKLFFGSQGTEKHWCAASEHSSPDYMVRWSELPIVKAK